MPKSYQQKARKWKRNANTIWTACQQELPKRYETSKKLPNTKTKKVQKAKAASKMASETQKKNWKPQRGPQVLVYVFRLPVDCFGNFWALATQASTMGVISLGQGQGPKARTETVGE